MEVSELTLATIESLNETGTAYGAPAQIFFKNWYYFAVRVWRCLFCVNHSFCFILDPLERAFALLFQEPIFSKRFSSFGVRSKGVSV